MQERRVLFRIGISYNTTQEKIEAVPDILRAAVERAGERTRFDRAHFASFGHSSLEFEVVYYVLVPDYKIYMDIQQTINLTIRREFAARGIDFAYPSYTIDLAHATVTMPQAGLPSGSAEKVPWASLAGSRSS
jgi:small-conductance mechanosensitive channel